MRNFMHYALLFLAVIGAGVLLIIGFLFIPGPATNEPIEYGATFSRPYAQNELGLDADKVLEASLDELGVRHFRIGAYWKFLEPQPDTWDFSDLDKDIDAIEARNGTIVLAIGMKLPRWPECWQPDWLRTLPVMEQQAMTLKYITTVVERYRDRPSVVAWQVENEPHFVYGDCPKADLDFHQQETALVRTLDNTRPIVTTDSGELSLWTTFGKTVDKLGVSVYRVVRNPLIGTWHYWFVPPSFYRRKAELLRPFGVHDIYVSEFQMEPWNNKPLPETTIEDQMETFDLKQMSENITFASRMGIKSIDFWGIEWWYWMKEKQNHPEFWEMGKTIYTRP